MDEVETQVKLHCKKDFLVPKYTNFPCDSLEIILVTRQCSNSSLDNLRICHMA